MIYLETGSKFPLPTLRRKPFMTDIYYVDGEFIEDDKAAISPKDLGSLLSPAPTTDENGDGRGHGYQEEIQQAAHAATLAA